MTNEIDPTAHIGAGVTLGKYNRIGAGVVIDGFKGKAGRIVIGDCNTIHDNTRILCDDLTMGDWNVLHNSMLVHGERTMIIGHNGWFGQNTILDSTGGLTIGNGVRVGMYSQVWTHAASGELIEGCTLYAKRPTTIEDEVWLVGSCIVGSGLRLGRRSICLIGSNVTKDTQAGRVYAGVPAALKPSLSYYKPITVAEKLELMAGWAREFGELTGDEIVTASDSVIIRRGDGQMLVILAGEFNPEIVDKRVTWFSLASKTYTKRLSELEREFYRFIFGHRARFVPA